MHVMCHDVKEQFNDPQHQKTFQHINFQELLYADDTLIIAKSAKTANASDRTRIRVSASKAES